MDVIVSSKQRKEGRNNYNTKGEITTQLKIELRGYDHEKLARAERVFCRPVRNVCTVGPCGNVVGTGTNVNSRQIGPPDSGLGTREKWPLRDLGRNLHEMFQLPTVTPVPAVLAAPELDLKVPTTRSRRSTCVLAELPPLR